MKSKEYEFDFVEGQKIPKSEIMIYYQELLDFFKNAKPLLEKNDTDIAYVIFKMWHGVAYYTAVSEVLSKYNESKGEK
jgi:hypothetical protein